jgi:ketosteroid isomerase-like protein
VVENVGVRTRVTWIVEKRGEGWEIVFQQMTPRL